MSAAPDTTPSASRFLPLAIDNEFKGLRFGDKRNDRNGLRFALAHAAQPDKPYPEIACSDAELQAFYHLLSESKITPQEILAPHFAQTVQRCAQLPRVLVIHDTSVMKFDYKSDRECLGHIDGNQRGFLFHPSLAIDPETVCPLGVLAFRTWSRLKRVRKGKKPGNGSEHAKRRFANKESARWPEQVNASEKRLADVDCQAIHVLDQEGDNYGVLGRFSKAQRRFVVRIHYDRVAKGSEEDEAWSKISEVLETIPLIVEIEVEVSERRATSNKKKAPKSRRQPRSARLARCEVSAGSVVIKRPSYGEKSLPAEITGNVVRVREIDPPEGEERIEWLLFTTEPVGSVEEVLFVINSYRARWPIEEFFSAIKTGCGYKKRELETMDGLVRALAFSVPVAWYLLVLRSAEQTRPQNPARQILSEQQIELLRNLSTRVKLPEEPTIGEAVRAIAGLGGFVSWNKRAGWRVLKRGLQALLQAERGWIAALSGSPGRLEGA